MLTVIVEDVGRAAILRCQGRIVRGEEFALLCAAVQHYGEKDVVIDLAEVSAIDAAGVGALVSLQAAGVYLKLINPSEPVRTVLTLTGINSILEICEEVTTPSVLLVTPESAPLLA